jgi:23S rRNA (uridine2552-2'-O)-methyltransferase
MAKSKSSKRWLQEHCSDQYVKQSKQDGYRSRASYKLLELHKKDNLLRPGMVVIDLGSAPGGWSQVAASLVSDAGFVLSSDILPMDTIAGVHFIQGDFTEELVLEQLLTELADRQVDLVISDMAPNISGMADIDQPRVMYLVELALAMAASVLKPGGNFVIKVFQGEGFDTILADMRTKFIKVISRKPSSSRARSREIYLVAKGFKG